jgi:hypothetical protein
MTRLGGWAQPGSGTIDQTTEREIFWGGDRGKGHVLEQSAKYSGAMRDAGNTPTTVLRAGLLMGTVTSSGELEEWDADASDGTQELFGVLPYELRAQDFDANNADRVASVVVRAPLKVGGLLIQGTAFTSHVDEFLARRQLHAAGSILDDDPQGFKAGAGGRIVTDSTAAITITEAQNGTTFISTHTAANIAITLPTIHSGLEYWILRGANSADDWVINSAEGDNLLVGNDVAADSVTWTTTGQQIGAGGHIRSVYNGTTLQWHVDLFTPPFGTGLTGGFAYSIAT